MAPSSVETTKGGRWPAVGITIDGVVPSEDIAYRSVRISLRFVRPGKPGLTPVEMTGDGVAFAVTPAEMTGDGVAFAVTPVEMTVGAALNQNDQGSMVNLMTGAR